MSGWVYASACVLCLSCVARAGAQTESDTPSQALFVRAQAAYDAGDWAASLELLQDAYALSPRPGFLFNIGQAQRKLGQCERAKESYTAYLAAIGSDASAEARVAAALRELESCREVTPPASSADAAVADPEPQLPAASKVTTDAPILAPLPVPSESIAVPVVTWTLVGSGAVALLTSGYLALAAQATASELEQADRWDAERSQLESAGRDSATTARVLLGVGAGLLAGALAVQLLFGGADETSEPAVAVGVTDESLVAGYSARF